MARFGFLLVAFAAPAICFLSSARAADPAPSPLIPGSAWKNRMMGRMEGEPIENVRRAMESLTPEQRQRFKENFIRWMNLAPEEKKALRDREEQRRAKMAEEVEAAIQESGLQLPPPQRELFVRRYAEERLKLETRLRKEMDEKRKPLVRDIIARLKTEFSGGVAGAAPASAPPPAVSPAPGATIQTAAPK